MHFKRKVSFLGRGYTLPLPSPSLLNDAFQFVRVIRKVLLVSFSGHGVRVAA